jgi:predicted DNA-binding transcriptional regulator AlpA
MQAENIKPAQTDKPKRGGNQPLHAAQIADALLTLRTASAVAGLSEATLYRKAKTDPTFPTLVKMGKRCTRIRAGALTALLASKAGA